MAFVRNGWYVTAWSAELGREPIEQRIIGERVALYRGEDGRAAAVAGTCPHRFAPLWKGKVVGNTIECPYHGLRFDRSGACVLNQLAPGAPPPSAAIASYPVVERDRLIFVWMGDPALADPGLLPDTSALMDTERYDFGPENTLHQGVDYELVLDNLMDLSHVQFLHVNSIASAEVVEQKMTTKPLPNGVRVDRESSDSPAPGFLIAATVFAPGDRVDTWGISTWFAPGFYFLETGGKPAGARREDGEVLKTLHLVTPKDETTTTYRYITYRSFARGNAMATAGIEHVIAKAFTEEDEPMIRDIQERMGGRDFWDLKPLILPTDKAAVIMRRTLAKMAREEAKEMTTEAVAA